MVLSRFIAITGPECSGKTTLSKALADELMIPWVPEYAREFLEGLNREYFQTDLDKIAAEQERIWKEVAATKDHAWIIKDSDQTVMRVWSEVKYGESSPQLLKLWEREENALHVLCRPDMEWQYDELRENPFDREELFELYHMTLKASGRRFIVVEGKVEKRVQSVLEALRGIEGIS